MDMGKVALLRRCLVLLLVLAGLSATAGSPLAQEGGDVPMFRGNAARTGEMPGPGPDPTNGVKIRWQFAAGGDVLSSPAVVESVVYVGTSVLEGDGTLYALDAATGTERWRFATGERIGSPAVADGAVYVGGKDGNLYALDGATGTERWRLYIGDYIVISSPPVVDGIVYVGSASPMSNVEDNVYAVDAETAAERWRFATVGGFTSPAVADGVVYVGGNDGNVYALDAATGAERWRFAIGDFVVISSPPVVDGVVYVGSGDGNVYALEAAKPQLENGTTAEIAEDGTDLRGGPAESAVVRAELDAGAVVTITGEAVVAADSVAWWPVTLNDTGEVGWVRGEDLVAVFPEE